MARVALTLTLGFIALPLGSARAVVDRPKPLPSQAACDSYQGTASGNNDPTQLFELRVCPSSTGVQATLQSSSLVSGHSLRASEGSWDASGTTLTLVETRFLDSRPEPGWTFCLIDELVLTKTAEGLAGTYVSKACQDRADLQLTRIEPSPSGTGPSGTAPTSLPPTSLPPPGTAPPRVEPPPASVDDSRPEGCSCSSTAPSSPAATLLGLVLVIGLRRRDVTTSRRA